MKSSLTIRNADVVLPGNTQKTDVSVINGVINAIGSEIPEVGEVIDAEGLFLIPGIIDPQVHFANLEQIIKKICIAVHVLHQQEVLPVFWTCRIIILR